jgi:PAS domain S-box-containing protein
LILPKEGSAQMAKKAETLSKSQNKKLIVGLDLSTMRPFLEGLLRDMQGGVFTVNLNKEIISFNKAAEWITGYCLDDVLGKKCNEIFKSTICKDACHFGKVIRRGGPVYKSDVTIIGKDGREIPVSLTCFLLKNVHGETVGMSGIFRDISELKTLRGQLMQSEKLAIMGQLAAGVAHEINNPISGILTYIKLLAKKLDKDGMSETLVPTFRKYLSVMERETANVGRIVKNLLDFSRRKEPDISPIHIEEIIDQSLLLLGDQLKVGNVEVERKGKTGFPEIMGDFGQLQQVFVNLMLNALQAMRSGGKLKIKTTAEGSPGRECFVKIEVADNGCGIPKEDIPNIFDPFFTTKGGDDGTGLGLGLSIVQKIIKAHHGNISLKSRVGKGTIFTIKLPTR